MICSSERDFLKSKIDEYKYGIIDGDAFCADVEAYLGTPHYYQGDEDLARVIDSMLPEIIRSYREEGVPEKDRDLKFWIGLKDCDYLLYYGRTFSEEREEYYRTGRERDDPVVYTDRYLAIEPKMEKLVRAETGEGGWTGFCHTYWRVKKKVLKEQFGIDWESTDDRFPGLLID